jgi:electron transport complex protein RnfG
MVLVLGIITLASGIALGALHEATWELAANNVLKFKKIPAVVEIYRLMGHDLSPADRLGLEERLLAEKRLVDVGANEPLLVFVLQEDGRPSAVALEGAGQGFGGDVGVMVGIGLDSGDVTGIGVTTMSETPGVGTRVREEAFTRQFAGLPAEGTFQVKKDGGTLDSITGATVSSRAVAGAVTSAVATYREHEDAIRDAVAAGPDASSAEAPGGVS